MRKLVLSLVVPIALVVMAGVAHAVEAPAAVDIRNIRLTERGAIRVVFRAGCEPEWTASHLGVGFDQAWDMGAEEGVGGTDVVTDPVCDAELHRLVAHIRPSHHESFDSGAWNHVAANLLVQPSDPRHTDCRERCVYYHASDTWQGRLLTGVPVKP